MGEEQEREITYSHLLQSFLSLLLFVQMLELWKIRVASQLK